MSIWTFISLLVAVGCSSWAVTERQRRRLYQDSAEYWRKLWRSEAGLDP